MSRENPEAEPDEAVEFDEMEEFAAQFLHNFVPADDIPATLTAADEERLILALQNAATNPDTNDYETLVLLAASFLRDAGRMPEWLATFAADVLEGKRKRPTRRGTDNYQLDRNAVRAICINSETPVSFGYVCVMAWGGQGSLHGTSRNVVNAWDARGHIDHLTGNYFKNLTIHQTPVSSCLQLPSVVYRMTRASPFPPMRLQQAGGYHYNRPPFPSVYFVR
jgi:hypothetical protein